jgi:hypothetical protein
MSRLSTQASTLSPLESFVRDYVEAREGVWDEIEPQVYDLLVGPEITRVAFDPEALPEHPRAQLASLGSPLIDQLLADAASRWSSTRLYRIGLNLHPHDLGTRVRRAIALPEGWALRVEQARRMHFPQTVFYFKATFSSDQKEEELLAIGVDLHYLREVRQLDALTAPGRLSEVPEAPLPEAPHSSLAAGYRLARDHAARSFSALANVRRREGASRVERQIARMIDYYAQLRQEAREFAERSAARVGEADTHAADRAAARIEAIDREEHLRTAELRQKSTVRVQVKLAGLMVIAQPKLLLHLVAETSGRPAAPLQAVWDPLSESLEAISCPHCAHPTFEFRANRTGLVCAGCFTPMGRR